MEERLAELSNFEMKYSALDSRISGIAGVLMFCFLSQRRRNRQGDRNRIFVQGASEAANDGWEERAGIVQFVSDSSAICPILRIGMVSLFNFAVVKRFCIIIFISNTTGQTISWS